MKIFHISDTHLGYSAFARMDPERGINQREADFYDSFTNFVNLALEEEPDIVIHTGDLFDAVRPSNRAISIALEQIRRLVESGIQFVAISGNHETPRLRETGSVFRIIKQLRDCYLAYEGGLKEITLDGIELLCLPHSTEDIFRRGITELLERKKELPRVVMLHAGIVGLGVFRTDEINEIILQQSELDPSADYIAMGHFHNYTEISNNACYSGSTERLSIAEAKKEKGFVDVDINTGKRRFVKLPTRRMLDFPPLDLDGASAKDAKHAITNLIESDEIEGAIIRITLSNISREAMKELDLNAIRKVAQGALNLDLKVERGEVEETVHSTSAHIGSLEDEFRRYLSNFSMKDDDKRRIEKLAIQFFEEQEE